MGSKMSNNIKAKSCTIEQDGVEIELVADKEYEFLDENDSWVTAIFRFCDRSSFPLCTNKDDYRMVREIKAPEMRSMTQLEAIEHLSVLSRTKVVLADLGDGFKHWTKFEYLFPYEFRYCILENGKLGEPMKLEIEQ